MSKERREGRLADRIAREPDAVRREGEGREIRTDPARIPESEVAGPRVSDAGPEGEGERDWPGEADEAAFLAGEKEQFTRAAAGAGPGSGAAKDAPLVIPSSAEAAEVAERGEPPPLEELVQRIPAELRAALDELFRARFTRATRVRASDKKAGPA